MAVLLPLWTRKHPTARKLRQRIGAIMKWAIAQGYRNDNPTGDAIAAALPKHANHVRHMPALPHAKVAGAIEAVNASSAWAGTKLCFEFMVLTAVRLGEARGARWEEIDFKASVWTIPETRMKATREHRVPLCARAVEVLHAAERLRRGSTTSHPPGSSFPVRVASSSPTPGSQSCSSSWRSGPCRMASVRLSGTGRPSGRITRGR